MACAMLKVSGGIRYLRTRIRQKPDFELMRDLYLGHGEYAVRPYALGQVRDGLSSACVFALLDDYCRHVGIGALTLIHSAYPFADILET
jgi:hypothetical protein